MYILRNTNSACPVWPILLVCKHAELLAHTVGKLTISSRSTQGKLTITDLIKAFIVGRHSGTPEQFVLLYKRSETEPVTIWQ